MAGAKRDGASSFPSDDTTLKIIIYYQGVPICNPFLIHSQRILSGKVRPTLHENRVRHSKLNISPEETSAEFGSKFRGSVMTVQWAVAARPEIHI